MKIGVVGSCYGELDRVYDAVRKLAKQGITIDLLICCGDFMSVRDEKDLEHVAAPAHHKEDPKDFPKYFSGRSEAPVTTIFIGGKNEASNLLREHYYGGWVAPGIYYMGAAGVLRVGPLRIAGISGSFHSGDYFRGRHECPPYTEEFKRSAFHAREWDAARLEKLQDPVDIVISYDWPRGIWKHGPYQKIIEQQDLGENLKREMEGNTLGSLAAMEVMKKLRPPFWFSASLQVRFPALVAHGDGTFTRFLALERCRGGKEFLQVLDIDPRWASAMCRLPAPCWQRTEPVPSVVPLCYDAEWMAIQKVNHQNISFSWHPEKARVAAPSKEDIRWIKERLKSICGVRPRPHGARHPNLTPTKLRKSRGAGRQTFRNFSTLQLRELFEIRGMNFPGHLDKASMIHHLEEFDALHGGEDRFSKDPEECYPIPTGFLSTPSAQRGKILEMLELPDIWKDQEEHRRQLLRAASGADVVTYDPFSETPDPLLETPAGKADGDETDPGAITGRSPSPSTATEEEDVTAPKVISTSREGLKEAQLQEPEPEPRKDESAEFHSVNDMNGGEAAKHLLEMGLEGDEDESVNDLKDPEVDKTQVEATEVALPSEDFTMEDEEAEHLALADDLAKLEAEIALAEQLLNPEDPQDPEEPEPAADLLTSVPMVPMTLESEQPVISVLDPTDAEEAAELLAAAVMGLNEEPEDPEEEDIDGGEVQVDCGPEHLLDLAEAVDGHLGDVSTVADWTVPLGTEATGFAALALALEEADREEAEEALQVNVPRAPRKRRRF